MVAKNISLEDIKTSIVESIEESKVDIYNIAKKLYENPELAFKEFIAHDHIAGYFESLDYLKVTRHAYGVDTSFEVVYENGGKMVNFNAEMDALPDIGHGCGHNLIAASSCAAFLGLVKTLRKFNLPGSVQLLGTPAEESLGGKCQLINNGAYKNISASFMAHPMSQGDNDIQISTKAFLACSMIECEYTGASAHASAFPWEGINAFDACVGSWVNISMLRQQIMPYQRIHGYFKDGPTVANVIPEKSTAVYQFRSRTIGELKELKKRVENCCIGAAMATGCSYKLKDVFSYTDMLNVPALVDACFEASKELFDDNIKVAKTDAKEIIVSASSDIGNVSQEIPTIHCSFGIPTLAKCPMHSLVFAKSAGNLETSMPPTLKIASLLAFSAYQVLSNDELFNIVKKEHDEMTNFN